jgi:hypothetical protein
VKAWNSGYLAREAFPARDNRPMDINPFRIERYYARYEFTTRYLLLPGSVYDAPSHVRIGFGRANMPDALQLLEECLGAPAAA